MAPSVFTALRHSRIYARRRLWKKKPLYALLIGATGVALIAGAFASFKLAELGNLSDSSAAYGIRFFDRHDNLVCVMSGGEERMPVSLKHISPYMREAVIAAEDHSFYKHHGIDPLGVLRALLVDIKSGKVREGGSTITQQLAKNLYSKSAARTILRKAKEAIIAWQLENKNSKDKILESYLNEIYFGRNAYGIERAAEEYFGKSADKLNISESAFLAGVVSSPSRLGAKSNLQVAINRQHYVLDNMLECKFISAEQATHAKSSKLAFRKSDSNISDNMYYFDAAMDVLRHQPELGQDLAKRGLNVYTNLDQLAQHNAVQAVTRAVIRAPRGVSQAALVSISVPDSAVIALVGGAGDFWKHQWNRATSPHTMGSAFKPFVYLAGILSGTITPHTVLYDQPITIAQDNATLYTPRNFDRRFMGALTVREALALSRNVCAVEVANSTGIDKVIETARLAGIKSELYPGLSTALGACAASPLEMANAYSTLARGGVAENPVIIRKVTDASDSVLLNSSPTPRRVFDEESVAELVDIMQDVLEHGTGVAAQLPGRAVAGKTGTADQAKDIWFVGFTPDTVTATWGGNDQQIAVAGTGITGGTVMAGIWKDYMQSYYRNHPTPALAFNPPEHPLDRQADSGIVATIDNGINDVENAAENAAKQFDQKLEKKHGFFGMFKKLVGLFH